MSARFNSLFVLFILLAFSQAHAQTLRLVSYNIKNDYDKTGPNNWTDRKSSLIELLQHYHPDVFGVQEALYNQCQDIKNGLKNYAYIGVGRDDGASAGEFAAIFFDSTRFKVVYHSDFWLSETPGRPSIGWDASYTRICTYGALADRQSGKTILVMNTHFDHLGETARLESAKLMIDRLKEINQDQFPVILMGDFNAKPNEAPIMTLKTFLIDASTQCSAGIYGPQGTFNGFNQDPPVDRIDYFFVDNKAQIHDYVHIDDRADDHSLISDHLPVMIDMSW